jgi:hypothetical protein
MAQITQLLRWKLCEKHRDGWGPCNWAAVAVSYENEAERVERA